MSRRSISPWAMWTLAAFSLLCAESARATVTAGQAQHLTWSCTGSPCPWGATDSGYALVWPSSGTTQRLGYTVSGGAYLPASSALGLTIAVQSGSATAFAGTPNAASHRVLGSITPGAPLTIVDVSDNEVVSVQSGGSFSYTIDDSAPVTPAPTAAPTSTTAPPPTATATTTAAPTPPPSATTTPTPPATGGNGTSVTVTWNCTSSPCPWGSPLSGSALAWPAGSGAVTSRLGYSASQGVYLPAANATAKIVKILSGSVSIYAGAPSAASHRVLTSLGAGQEYLISGLNSDDVVSVQADGTFTYELAQGTVPAPTPTTTSTSTPPPAPTGTGTTTPPPAPTSTGTTTPPPAPAPTGGEGSSATVTWTCTSSPCPWGNPLSGSALIWPAGGGAVTSRLGYTASAGVYLPAASATGTVVTILSGSASIYAGAPPASSHRVLASLGAGQQYVVSGLSSGDVVSVQADGPFTYALSHDSTPPSTDPPPPVVDPPPPIPGDVIDSVQARWRCNTPGCSDGDWVGAVINWPSWAAYHNNARAGGSARAVFSDSGQALYPYMGSWANGCEVTAHYGLVLIIEWERGTDLWRETYLEPGQTHTIHLTSPENGAMIETVDYAPNFGVSLKNCTPQPL